MKTITTFVAMATITLFVVALTAFRAQAATNAANNVAGGSQTLTASGTVTVNSSTIALVKQVYDSAGNCLASSPADAACSSSAISTTVPTGTVLTFLIFTKNNTAIALTDIRFQDALDITGTGFTYVASSIKRTQTGVSEPAATDSAATIFTNANGGTVQTDLADADVASFVSPNVTAGATTNGVVSIPANKAFGIRFQASKN